MSLELVFCHGQNVILVCLGMVSLIFVRFLANKCFPLITCGVPPINTGGLNCFIYTIIMCSNCNFSFIKMTILTISLHLGLWW